MMIRMILILRPSFYSLRMKPEVSLRNSEQGDKVVDKIRVTITMIRASFYEKETDVLYSEKIISYLKS